MSGKARNHVDPSGSSADSASLLIALYNGARAELVQRIQQRDQTLVLFIGVVGVAFSAAFSDFTTLYVVLFLVPYLGLGATFVSMQHDSIIGSIEHYCAFELGPHLQDIVPDAPQWDTSKSVERAKPRAAKHRLHGHVLLLVLPQIAAAGAGLFGLVEHTNAVDELPCLVLAVLGLVVLAPVAYSIYLVADTYRQRRRLATDVP